MRDSIIVNRTWTVSTIDTPSQVAEDLLQVILSVQRSAVHVTYHSGPPQRLVPLIVPGTTLFTKRLYPTLHHSLLPLQSYQGRLEIFETPALERALTAL